MERGFQVGPSTCMYIISMMSLLTIGIDLYTNIITKTGSGISGENTVTSAKTFQIATGIEET